MGKVETSISHDQSNDQHVDSSRAVSDRCNNLMEVSKSDEKIEESCVQREKAAQSRKFASRQGKGNGPQKGVS